MKFFITGTSGFVGFHLARHLLEAGHQIHGFDSMNDYYDVEIKKSRLDILNSYQGFVQTQANLEDYDCLKEVILSFKPDVIFHLAAQAGVRYSFENPESYIKSNVVGTYNLLEVIKNFKLNHFLFASTSSVYGSNDVMPFTENQQTDSQLSIYSATKKSCESLIHSYSYLFNIPSTVFRFFTVYGPYGRPDMALFRFVKAITEGEEIEVYNNGEMFRDFTYIDDLVKSISLLSKKIPEIGSDKKMSNSAPYRVVNIGNSKQVKLEHFITVIEDSLGMKAKKKMMPMQLGDVQATLADNSYLKDLTGFAPEVNVEHGVKEFVEWYMNYYNVKDSE